MGKSILDNLAALNLSANPYEEAKKLIYKLERIGIIEYTLHAGKTLTRGRTNGLGANRQPSFALTSELSYKPQKYNNEYQRASTPQQTMFYGSVLPPAVEPGLYERMISVSEASILLRGAHIPDDTPEMQEEGITFGSWVVTEDIPLVAVCYHKALSQKNLLGKELYEAFERGTAQLREPLRGSTRATNAFFAEEFGKPSHNFQGHYEYLLSAVFAEIAVERGFAGVYFPSVKADGQGFNVAISPAFTDKSLKLEKVLECTLYKRDGRFLLDADKFCEVERGAAEFTLQLLTDPKLHSSPEQVRQLFDAQRQGK
jgi:hypothetical protein